MKITLKELKSLIRETVESELKTLNSEPFIGAIGEKKTIESEYIRFVQGIFNDYSSHRYNIKDDEGQPVFAIYDNDNKKAAIKAVFDKLALTLALTEEQKQKLLKPFATLFFGTTFPIHIENLAAIVSDAKKMASEEV